jgi:hypothetical protein
MNAWEGTKKSFTVGFGTIRVLFVNIGHIFESSIYLGWSWDCTLTAKKVLKTF